MTKACCCEISCGVLPCVATQINLKIKVPRFQWGDAGQSRLLHIENPSPPARTESEDLYMHAQVQHSSVKGQSLEALVMPLAIWTLRVSYILKLQRLHWVSVCGDIDQCLHNSSILFWIQTQTRLLGNMLQPVCMMEFDGFQQGEPASYLQAVRIDISVGVRL